MTRAIAGYTAFKSPILLSDPYVFDDDWADWDSRKLRYFINWNFYQNTAYDPRLQYSKTYKTQYGLYRYIRNIYNPSYRLAEFWKSHIWGGKPLEFETENEDIAPALAQIYRWSNWAINKDTLTLYGASMGDVGLRVRDDKAREKVYFEVIHPGAIKAKTLDPQGNVRAYTLEEPRANPQKPGQTATYTEIAERNGDNVVIQTLLDGKPFPWDGEESEFSIPYGFVPMIFIQHLDVGMDWGWSELHAGLSKFMEVDDLASKTSDQIRKLVDPIWFYTGVPEAPTSTPTLSRTQPTAATLDKNPFPGREETDAIYVKNENAKATALVADINLADVLAHIKSIMANIELDYPELKLGIDLSGAGEISGRALRVAREGVSTRVEERRVNYDDALLRANMMALAIAGMRQYPGFETFNLDSFDKGDLDHSIKPRPVFSLDPLDIAEIDQAQALAIKTEQEALNWPTVTAWRRWLEREGLSEDEAEKEIIRLLKDAKNNDGFGFTDEI